MEGRKNKFFFRYLLIFRDSGREFMNDRALKLSAALAYYTVFSLPPMLVVIVAICSIFFGRDAVQGRIFGAMEKFVGPDVAAQLEDILRKTTLHHDNILATVIGVITLVIGATGVFGEMQDSINFIWRLKAKPKKGLVKILLNRLVSFSMLLVLGFLLLVSLVMHTLLGTFFEHLRQHLSDSFIANLHLLNNLSMLLVTTLLFAFIFKALPDARVQWRDVWVSSLVTSFLFLLGSWLISFYLEHNASISTYGAAGSVIVLLLWVYYSSIILYFGAEFTQVYVRHHHRSIRPNKYAVWIENRTVEKDSLRQTDKSKEKHEG